MRDHGYAVSHEKEISGIRGASNSPTDLSRYSRPKFTMLRGHMGVTLLFNKFFPVVDTCLSCEDIALA